MRVLVLTGRMVGESVKKLLKDSCDILILPIDVAALMTERMILESLSKIDVSGYDLILVPGLAPVDTSRLEERLGVPIRRGPKSYVDIPEVLSSISSPEDLSTRIPADDVLRIDRSRRFWRELKELWSEDSRRISFRIGEIAVGRGTRPVIVAEVSGATDRELDEILEESKRFIDAGADIVSLGCNPSNPRPERIRQVIGKIKGELDVPLAIDTLDASEILASLHAEVDLVLSLSWSNLEVLEDVIDSGCPAVLIPRRPGDIEDLLSLRERARELGLRKLILDPLLDPIRVLETLCSYRDLSMRSEDPIMAGLGNVVEMIDADTPGALALLTWILSEVGVSIYLVSEVSRKCRGCVREARLASLMAYLARKRNIPMKDLGEDLLILKEKREKPWRFEPRGKILEAEERRDLIADPRGNIRIWKDDRSGYILAEWIEGGLTIRGRRARDIARKLIEIGAISRLDHAAYIGRELQKAEIALKLGRSYVQDEELF